MKTVIAIDSFKGSLSSPAAGEAAAEGIRRVFPDAEIIIRPIADGGEGTVAALISGLGGEARHIPVCNPLGDTVTATYGIIRETKTAIIEMSAAAGLTLIPSNMRDSLYTTTYGVGEMIADAINEGCRNFIIGIGGSATNDGGAGMLSALGFNLLDADGKPIPLGAIGLGKLRNITDENVLPLLGECRFKIACDVTNPLCGKNGCSAVFAPQKGADAESVARMDGWLENFARLTKEIRPASDKDLPGAGAAGGCGFAFSAFLRGELVRGIELILAETDLERYITDADLVITGEGRLDAQTAMGKAPAGVAAIAKRHGKPVIAFSGCVTEDAGILNRNCIDAYFPILREACTVEQAMLADNAYANLADTAEQVFRCIALSGRYAIRL